MQLYITLFNYTSHYLIQHKMQPYVELSEPHFCFLQGLGNLCSSMLSGYPESLDCLYIKSPALGKLSAHLRWDSCNLLHGQPPLLSSSSTIRLLWSNTLVVWSCTSGSPQKGAWSIENQMLWSHVRFGYVLFGNLFSPKCWPKSPPNCPNPKTCLGHSHCTIFLCIHFLMQV